MVLPVFRVPNCVLPWETFAMKIFSLLPQRFVPTVMLCLAVSASSAWGQSTSPSGKTRLDVIGLDHDHVWGLLKDLAGEPNAELVAIADSHSELVDRAKGRVPASVKFYSDYIQMLNETKPDGVIVTTENDRHLEILRECAKRHIDYSTEKPMATSASDAREMERLANQAGIKVMVNYWNAWVAPTHELYHRVHDNQLGPAQRIIVQYGHQGPKEIGVSRYFADWLYDPVKNGGGAIMDFGCYGAEWALWVKGRPTSVYATTRKLKIDQHNRVDDDATLTLNYPDSTAVIEASWDWPYSMDRVYVFGSKGSLLATRDALIARSSSADNRESSPDGNPASLSALPHGKSNPIAYLLSQIHSNDPVEDPLSGQ